MNITKENMNNTYEANNISKFEIEKTLNTSYDYLRINVKALKGNAKISFY